MRQAEHAPVRQPRDSALAMRRLQFLDLEVHLGPTHFHQDMPEEPPVLVFSGGAQMAAGARHRNVRDASQLHAQQLVNVARYHILHSVLACEPL